jgi:hypothetical protein
LDSLQTSKRRVAAARTSETTTAPRPPVPGVVALPAVNKRMTSLPGHHNGTTHVAVVPAPSRQPLSIPAAQQSPSTPTIHVTIGRIEIRATPPSAPPQRPRAAAPVMGLDEYLRQRNAGGSR